MPHLVTTEHLASFLSSLGVPEESITTLDHEVLLGFTSAVLDYEARYAETTDPKSTYGHEGYTAACKTLSAGKTPDERSVGHGTVAVRLAEQSIARTAQQISTLNVADEDTPKVIKTALDLLFATGVLLSMTNNELTHEQCKFTVKAVQTAIVQARHGLDDVKREMRTKGINV